MNLVGQKFGKLTVLSLARKKQLYFKGNRNGFCYEWLCLCECGNKTIVEQQHLKSGHTQSCGCHQINMVAKQNRLSSSRLYGVWRNIKKRCYDKNSVNYKNYGGRGITVCKEWKDNFLSFYDWALKNGYNEKAPKMECTLDRINVNGNYCPQNCRWVNSLVQQRNKNTNKLITINNKTMCVSAWCDKFGIIIQNLYSYCKNNSASLEEGLYVLTHKKWDKSKQQWVDK